MNGIRLRQLPPTARYALALLLAALAVAYLALLVSTYCQLTSPGAFFPAPRDLSQALFPRHDSVSQIERLLTSTSGEMASGGTMRPAFTEHSDGWQELNERLSRADRNVLLKEREGERLALLDWVRSAEHRAAYEQDDHRLSSAVAITHLTAKYQRAPASPAAAPNRVKIRTLITDRCVTCHGENGRHDTARFIELNSYERLAPRLLPEHAAHPGRPWLLALLFSLFPLAAVVAPLFALTQHPLATRLVLLALTAIGLALIAAAWLIGPRTIFLLPIAALTVASATLAQIQICLQELLSRPLNSLA